MRPEDRFTLTAVFWFCLAGVLLLLLFGCDATLSAEDRLRINSRFDLMHDLSQLPMPRPQIIYTSDNTFVVAGETNCSEWTITVSYAVAASRPDFVIEKLVPHEYAHLVSCYYRGSTAGADGNAHDDYWRKWVIRFGGDPEYI